MGVPVSGVGKFIAIGLNYRDRAKEAGMAIPTEPVVFMKAISCLAGPNDDVVRPKRSTNDVSEREFQIERGGQWDKGKSFDTFGPVGPYLVTTDEVGDIHALEMWLDVNGEFDCAEIVSYLSEVLTLMPGDVICTGTPPGVGMGMKPPRYLPVGDVMTPRIEKLGEQRQRLLDVPGGAP